MLGIEDTNLALLHVSHELLQTPVLLQGFCHLLGSPGPDDILLQAAGDERGPSAQLVVAIPRLRTAWVKRKKSETKKVPSLFISAAGRGLAKDPVM